MWTNINKCVINNCLYEVPLLPPWQNQSDWKGDEIVYHSPDRDHGFTLVELMVVVLIVGILVSVSVPSFEAASENAKRSNCFATQNQLGRKIMIYQGESSLTTQMTIEGVRNFFPAKKIRDVNGQFVRNDGTKLVTICPDTKEEYGVTFPSNGDLYVISCSKHGPVPTDWD